MVSHASLASSPDCIISVTHIYTVCLPSTCIHVTACSPPLLLTLELLPHPQIRPGASSALPIQPKHCPAPTCHESRGQKLQQFISSNLIIALPHELSDLPCMGSAHGRCASVLLVPSEGRAVVAVVERREEPGWIRSRGESRFMSRSGRYLSHFLCIYM